LIVTILVIAAAPVSAQAQMPTPATVTKADAQKILRIISSDKPKTRVYCQMAKLGDQMEQDNETGDAKKFDALFQKMYELGKQLGPEYAALVTDFRTLIHNPKSVRRLVRPWMRLALGTSVLRDASSRAGIFLDQMNLTHHATCIPRRLHCAISSRRSGSRTSGPQRSIRICFRYWPARPHLPHDRRTIFPGVIHAVSGNPHFEETRNLRLRCCLT
jgi:hypothetical protein